MFHHKFRVYICVFVFLDYFMMLLDQEVLVTFTGTNQELTSNSCSFISGTVAIFIALYFAFVSFSMIVVEVRVYESGRFYM